MLRSGGTSGNNIINTGHTTGLVFGQPSLSAVSKVDNADLLMTQVDGALFCSLRKASRAN